MRHNIEMAEMAIKNSNFGDVPVYVTEYSLSLSNRSAINDSCIKGAYLIHNAISCLGKTEMLGHWLFTDAYAEEQDTGAPLFGGCGLLTKDGITKPAYYAFEFLNLLYHKVIAVHPKFIVTHHEQGTVRIVCHNMKKFNYNFHMAKEDSVKTEDISSIIEDREPLVLHLSIAHFPNGIYTVERNQLNRTYGSVQDRWKDLNMESNLTMRKLEYLKNISISKISIQQAEVKKHRLELDIELEANEIQYLHIIQIK